MFLDFRNIRNGTVIESDLCVIGAGAAGITIARELIGKSLRVCLLESGGLDYEAEPQALNEGKNIGLPYYALDETRLRYFGGTTNHWNGQCAPLSEMDFQVRPWVEYSGWPISKADLDPYYKRALPICELGPYVFDERNWKNFEIEPPPLDPTKIQSHFWQASPPTRFGMVYRDELKNAENIKVFLNANVTNIRTNNAGSKVTRIDVAALNGKTGHIKAKFFVLACGAIENARLLLLSNQVQPKGLGNRYDLVGRFFMDHPTVRFGKLLAADEDKLFEIYQKRYFEGIRYRPGLAMTKEMQIREQILNCCTTFGRAEPLDRGVQATRQALLSLKMGQVPEDLTEKIRIIMSDLDEVSGYLYCRIKGQEQCTPTVHVRVRIEQAPNPNSRVTLSDERDALGQNRLRLDWRMTALEKKTVKSMATIIGREFGRLNIGRVQLAEWLEEDGDPEWRGSYHHMGTTRMAENPKMGVVNKDCRIHGIDNLYVAGSSVFSTSGFVNPTLTLVALALRLADHLSGE